MAYQKQTWRDYDDTKTELQNVNNGAVVTPERLNHIENGIANSADKAEVTAQLQHIDGAFFKSLDYLFMKNTFSANPDQPTRFAVLPKGETTTGVGGVFKVFADDFSADQINYRDLGIYFSQNQRGDTGHNDGGVFWFNSKVGIDGKFLDKNADMAFSFQDGETIAGRVILDTSTGVDNAVFVIGSEKSKYASLFSSLGIPIGMEVQKDIYIQPDRMIRFVNENDVGLHGIRYNSTSKKLEVLFNGSVVFSLSVDGNELKNATIVNKYNSVATGTSILDGSVGGVYVVSDTTAITAVNGGTSGQEIRVLFATAGGILKNSATLKLKGGADFVATSALSSIKLLKISSGWVEVSRNVM